MKRRDFISSALTVGAVGLSSSAKAEIQQKSGFDEIIYFSDFLTEREILESKKKYPAVDYLSHFKKFMAQVSERPSGTYVISPGVYPCSDSIEAVSKNMRDVVIEARGVEIIITSEEKRKNKHYFRISVIGQEGRGLTVDGLKMRHNRAVGRCANTDMMLFAGFNDYNLINLTVESSDNMGITVGRGDPPGFTPENIFMLNPRVGGRYEESPHEYGPVGDSGIWIVNAPKRTHIVAPWVSGTGDDGILVGETVSEHAGHVFIEGADIKNCGGNGILVSVPYGKISGRIKNTNQSGIALMSLQKTAPGNFRIDAVIENAGQFKAGDIGLKAIKKRHPYGIWVHSESGEIDLDGTVIKSTFSSGVHIQARNNSCIESIRGRVSLSRICQDISGKPSGGADNGVIRRSGSLDSVVKDLSLDLMVTNCSCPLVQWGKSKIGDSDIAIKITFNSVNVNPSYYPSGSVCVFGNGSNNDVIEVENMIIFLDGMFDNSSGVAGGELFSGNSSAKVFGRLNLISS